MRKLVVLSIIMIAACHASASAFRVGIDLRCADSFFYPAVRVDGEFSYRFSEVRVSIPLRYSHSMSHELDFIETGLAVSVYPFEGYGFFASVSLLRAGYFWGLEAPEDPLLLFSEASVGWTFDLPHFFIEPRISITDAFSSEEGRLSVLSQAVPQYSRFRISLMTGFTF